jgi:TetR/AcrR family transcriptional regulator, tetracycline repressor protein
LALERETIVAAAMELLDTEGLDGLTMRRLADALGVQAPSIYWHYSGKPALLDDMADALLSKVEPLIAADAGPRDILWGVACQLRAALLARRDGARVFAGTFVARANVLRVAEATMQALDRADFTGKRAATTVFTMLYFVLGFVIEEQARAELPDGREQELRGQVAGFAAAASLLPELLDPDSDARFAAGLELILSDATFR